MSWECFQRLSFAVVFLAGVSLLLGAKQPGERPTTTTGGYALELLWWPEYCHEHPELRYCAGASFRGFVPSDLAEISNDGKIKSCTTASTSFKPDEKLLSLLPDEVLLRSQWNKHGACSGLSQNAYFGRVTRIVKSLVIPKQFVQPDRDFQMSPSDIQQAFARGNRRLSADGILVFCRSGFLSSIQIQTARKVVVPNGVCKDAHVEVIARMPLAE